MMYIEVLTMIRPQNDWINQDEIDFGLFRKLRESYINYELGETHYYNGKATLQEIIISGEDWYQFNKIVVQNRDDMLNSLPN